MLNIIWPIFLIISIIFSFFSGNLKALNNSFFESTESAVKLCLTLLGIMCLWSGAMKIVSTTSLINKITKILSPFMKLLFPKMKKRDEAYEQISMNVVANILGLGNAATPLGLKAMETMQKENAQKDRLTDEMATLIVLNTASIQIIPTTVIAIRSSLCSNNPTIIIFPVWIATICAAIAGISAVKFFIKIGK